MPGPDPRQLIAALDLLDVATHRGDFGAAAIAALDCVVRSEVTTFNHVDPTADRVEFSSRPEVEVSVEAHELLTRRGHEHPLIAHYAATRDGSACAISDLLDEDEFHTTDFYRVLYGPMGVEDQMAIVLPAADPVVVGLVANRCERSFSTDDREAMNALRPHAAARFRAITERERVEALLHATGTAIAGAGVHALVLDSVPYDVTGEAFAILECFFGRAEPGSPIPAPVNAWLACERLRRADRSLESRARIDAPLVGERGPDRLLVTLVSGVAGMDVLVLHRRDSVPSVERLESFAMSRREAEVVQLVIAGETNASIAATLFISTGTVKKHLDNVYRKLGVGNRAAAVATVLDLWANTP